MKKLLYILLLSPLFFISSCEEDVNGCTDSLALNFNENANNDDGSCIEVVIGCIDELACNFNSNANTVDNSCEYPELGYDCEGNFTEFVVGMEAEGGIVFYIDASGEHGLVAAYHDISRETPPGFGDTEWFEWGCYGINVNGADGYTIGTGYQNTLDIVANNCLSYNSDPQDYVAAKEALYYISEGYDDWYLPSWNELQEMLSTIGPYDLNPLGNIGGFKTDGSLASYWSSTEVSATNAEKCHSESPFNLSSPNQSLNWYKDARMSVRPIRSF